MAEYSVTVNATSNGTVNTEDTFVELSGLVVGILRVEARLGDGTATAGLDNDWRIRLVRKTAGGATGTGGTAVRFDQEGRTSGATVTVKNTTSAFTTATLGDVIYTQVCNGRALFQWMPRSDDEIIRTHVTLGSGGMFAVLIQSSVVSQKFQVNVLWSEA
jgi:hypothetical protein